MTGYSNGSGGLITDDAGMERWLSAFGEDLSGSPSHRDAMALHEADVALEVCGVRCATKAVEGYAGGLYWSGVGGGKAASVCFTGLPGIDAWHVRVTELVRGSADDATYRGRGKTLAEAVGWAEVAWERGHASEVVSDEEAA